MSAAFVRKCSNLFGPLDAGVRGRLEAVLRDPTPETWDDAHSIMLNGDNFMTLWQAWIAVDPKAPRTGKVTDESGAVLEGWRRIPDQLTLYRAIRYATGN